MEEENEIKTETITEVETKQEIKLSDLPRFEDMIKSEQDIKTENKLQGLQDAQSQPLFEDRPFTRKEDEHKTFVKKRLKLVTAIYAIVASLLLGFVGVNIATLAIMDKQINSNVTTIAGEKQEIELRSENHVPDADLTDETISITLNQPRDYNDDDKSLTIFDKLTILFRNLFN